MKVLLSTDIEGITGVTSRSMLNRKKKVSYKIPCQLMTDEVNAVISACFAGGATQVNVVDGHALGRNLFREQIDSRATVLKRLPSKMMMTGVEDCDVVMFIGYHGMASKPNSFCAHTNSTPFVKGFWVDGVECSEAMVNSLMAKHFGKKVIYINGTDKGISEFQNVCPSVFFTENLHSIDMENATSEPIPSHYEIISADVIKSLHNVEKVEFVQGSTKNVTITLELFHPYDDDIEGVEPFDNGYTVKFRSRNISSAYKKYRSVLRSVIRLKNSKS